MSRKQRIIVSVTGIFLVLLILVGLTYAYFLTKIKGNENNKSISVTTANLLLEYADVNDELITDSAVEPGKTWTKTFVATNKGNKTVTYGVALENIINILERKEDLVYTLDCKQYSKTGFSIDKTNKTVTGTISGTCNGVSDETTFPSIGTILVENDIADDKAQVYTLLVTYKETNTDQSVDMNKTFSAKANIVDPNNFKPYGTNTLATAIIDSAKTAVSASNTTRTIYQETPITTPGQAISTETEKTLSKTQDDYGDSYYFRGNVVDNFVNYAGMCWRIVRIEGDGSIKLILASELSCSDTNVTTSSGYATDGAAGVQGTKLSVHYGYKDAVVADKSIHPKIDDYINSTTGARSKLNTWLQTKITNENDKILLKNEDWCIGDRTTAYDDSTYALKTEKAEELISGATVNSSDFNYSAGKRIFNTETPTLKCDGSKERDGEIDTNKVGMLTSDEVTFAGVYRHNGNSTYYLNKNATSNDWWALSLVEFSPGRGGSRAFYLSSGGLSYKDVLEDCMLRVAVTLVSGTQITSGDGTVNNAYVVK